MVAIGAHGSERYPVKCSPEKQTLPGAKQIFRFPDHDVLGLVTECLSGSEALLRPVMLGGSVAGALPDAAAIRARAALGVREWPAPGRCIRLSKRLEALGGRASGPAQR
jgi:hypothetical protein